MWCIDFFSLRQQQRISNQQPKNNKVVRGKQDDLVLEVPGVGIVTTGVRPTGTNGLLRSGHLGRAPTRANNQDTGMAISGVGLANGTDIGYKCFLMTTYGHFYAFFRT